MGKLEFSVEKILSNVPGAEFVTNATQQDLEDNIDWDLNPIEDGACAFIVVTPTGVTPRDGIAQTGGSFQPGELSRVAVGTRHEFNVGKGLQAPI